MTEADIIKKFKDNLIKKYNRVDVYHVYSTSYGVQGQPDLIVTILGHIRPYLVEAKKNETLEGAVKDLRSTQVGRIEELFQVGQVVYLLYKNGCGKYLGNKQWKNYDNFDDAIIDK